MKNGCSSAGVALKAVVRYSSTSSFGAGGLSTAISVAIAGVFGREVGEGCEKWVNVRLNCRTRKALFMVICTHPDVCPNKD